MAVVSCSGTRPSNLGVANGRLGACPATPNCVSSDASDPVHHVEGFSLGDTPEAAWQALLEAVESLPRTTIVEVTDEYLYAECASAFFGFVDDLELHLRVSDDLIAVRSASRLGRSDLGVNRRRVEDLRELLRARRVVR